MTLNRKIACGIGLIASSVIGVTASNPAHATCLTTDPATAPFANNCTTYNTVGGSNVATLRYTDPNLSNQYWQLNTANVNAANFSNWQSSTDGTIFTSLTTNFTTTGAFTSSQVFSTSPGNPFYLRVTLSNAATLAQNYSFTILTNNNGYTDSNRLADDGLNNNYAALSRNFTRVADPVPPSGAVPGPVPLLGAAAAFRYSRKMRRAIKAHS